MITDWGASNDHSLGVKNGSNLEMPTPGPVSYTHLVKAFKEYGFTYVTMDLQGYRMGSMNETLKK